MAPPPSGPAAGSGPAPAPGAAYQTYAALTALAAPLATAAARRRFAARGGDPARFGERLGQAAMHRPPGRLAWLHAVSVGEAQSILGLAETLGRAAPELSFLITTTTPGAAEIVARRLPPRACHQFSPLDTPGAVRRFLAHWHPDLAIFVESELWPRLIVQTHARGTPLALVNARLSARSLARWRRLPGLARALLARFSLILAQSEETARGLVALGADPARLSVTGDLKAAADPLPVDAAEHARLARAIGDRPVWVAASTHPGEEEIVAAAHRAARAAEPGLLLLLLPRHPERGDAIEAMLRADGWQVARRGAGALPGPETEIYLADTLGETGLFYSLAPRVFLGGSFTPVGGHNPFEPASLGAAVLHGPLYANQAATYAAMHAAGAAREVADAPALAAALGALRGAPLAAMQEAARAFTAAQSGLRARAAAALLPLLPPAPGDGA